MGNAFFFFFPRLRTNSRNSERKNDELLGVSASALPEVLFFLLFLSLVPFRVAEFTLRVCACMELH